MKFLIFTLSDVFFVSGLRFYPPQKSFIKFGSSGNFQKEVEALLSKNPQAFDFQTSTKIQTRTFSTKLTHVDDSGKAVMVNVIDKTETKRIAIASGHVQVSAEITKLISGNLMKKGDVLSIAQIAGIMAAKTTSNLIPLTHNIPLSSVKVDLKLNEELNRVEIISTVECFGKTGVEIEALTAVSVAALTVYDMCKAVSHDITINNIQLVEKRGGKSHFKRI